MLPTCQVSYVYILVFLTFSISAFRLLLILMMVQLVFYVTHWEKYNTGVLFLSWCYDASQYVSRFFLISLLRNKKVSISVFNRILPVYVVERWL